MPDKSLIVDPLIKQVRDALNSIFAGSNKQKSILVALSGGPDSTALLLAMKHLAREFKLKIFACHINHNLRGKDSLDDEKFAYNLCKKLNIDFVVKKLSKSKTHVSEEYLRDKRYQILKSICQKFKCEYLATGHTLDDQIETLLFRMFRGTSPVGLIAMEPFRQLDKTLILMRPMLSVERNTVHKFLSSKSIQARLDKSNLDLAYARNYIRHAVIPAIELRFPGFNKRIDQLRNLLADNEILLASYVNEKSNELLLDDSDENHWLRSVFNKFDQALKRKIISKALQLRDIEMSFLRVEEIIDLVNGKNSGAISLNKSWDIRVNKKEIIWLVKQNKSRLHKSFKQKLKVPGITLIPGLNVSVKIIVFDNNAKKLKFPLPNSMEALVDLSLCKKPIVLRLRQAADVIKPFGMETLVKLKKYLHTHKSKDALFLEDIIIVMADQNEIIWVPGVGLSEKTRVDKRPTHKISIEKY
jgi:tRNA(Ile)-lysidine synthase